MQRTFALRYKTKRSAHKGMLEITPLLHRGLLMRVKKHFAVKGDAAACVNGRYTSDRSRKMRKAAIVAAIAENRRRLELLESQLPDLADVLITEETIVALCNTN